MVAILSGTWPLLTGILLLMLGNGIQGTLIGIRGMQEGFTTFSMSLTMSGYFFGLLLGSRLIPHLVRQVGHIRVFSALGSLISAALILFAEFTTLEVWLALRIVVGFCFSGIYIVAESWLNDSATNANRGRVLSIYVVVQLAGIIIAQGLLNVGDTQGYLLFIIASVLVSISFIPILLSVKPAPVYSTAAPMSIRRLMTISPLGGVGILLLGAMFSAILGMAPIFGYRVGLSVAQISLMVAIIFTGGLIMQYPIGFLSDRCDRRWLILLSSLTCMLAALLPIIMPDSFTTLLIAAFIIGGATNPLYSLLLAYTNDVLDRSDMAAAAGCLVFLNGIGASCGPLLIGGLMRQMGEYGFFVFIALVMLGMAGFCFVRMQIRDLPDDYEAASYAPVSPASTPIAHDMVCETALDEHQN